MKTLILFRHAKSGWDDPVARDFDRPLNARGRKAAELMGRHAAKSGLTFDRLLASPAVRCAETLDHFFAGYGSAVDPQWDRRIYLASAGTLIDVIRETPDDVGTLLLIGHNPGMEDLVLETVPESDGALRASIEAKFPTASIATLEIGEAWPDLGQVPARVVAFTRPRDLDPELGPDIDE